MMDKPKTAAGYPQPLAVAARRMCLHVATILGDLLDDMVVVAGLVPYLIIDQDDPALPRHVGTRDLDLGLSLGMFEERQYKLVSERLRGRGFQPSLNAKGNKTRQTWCLPESEITIDFLMPPSPRHQGGRIQDLEQDFAAMIMPALPLAFSDFMRVTIEGETMAGDRARRDVRVCGPAGLVGMKAHAFNGRGESKDAYDLVYTLRNFGDGTTQAIAERYVPLLSHPTAMEALDYLANDFGSPRHIGPAGYAEFLAATESSSELRADAFSYVARFLSEVERRRT